MQLHKRLTIHQVKQALDWYEHGFMSQAEVLTRLGLKRRRFFDLLKTYRAGQLKDITPKQRQHIPHHIALELEAAIRTGLEADKELIDNPDITISFYNYQAIRDRVVEQTGHTVSAQTVRNRAKAWGFYHAKPKSDRKHTRVVLTTATGLLLQHDASHHLWSPYAESKWCLITTIDDYSRLLVYADFWEEETAWSHIMALKSVVTKYGVGNEYYTDRHSIFKYVQRQESRWQTPKVSPEEIKTQWKQAVEASGMGTIWALSPEAKGKIERPYRWMQDRIVRICAQDKVTTIVQGREILRHEIERYNTKQKHSTTGEVPIIRFQRAEREGNTVFRPFVVPKPYTSAKDIFCLRTTRVVDGYSGIRWRNKQWKVPKTIPEGATVRLHIIPDDSHPELRIWYKDQMVEAILLTPTQKQYIPDRTQAKRG